MISGRAQSLLATHPPVEDRISALRAYAGARPTLPRPKVTQLSTAHAPRATFGRRTQSVGGSR
jgi:hypothetical protein